MNERNPFIVRRGFRKFFIATAAIALAEQLCTAVDMALVGSFVSAEAFAALELVIPFETIFYALMIVISGGGGIIASKLVGEHELKWADGILSTTLFISTAISVLISMVCLLLLDPLVALLSPDASLSIYLKEYLGIYLFNLLPIALYMVAGEIVNVDGKPEIVTGAVLAGCFVDILMDIIFMKCLGLGVMGQALATMCSYLASLGVLMFHLFSSNCTFHLRWKRRPQLSSLRMIFRTGLPYGLPSIYASVLCLVFNYSAFSTGGVNAVYAWGVAYQILALGMLLTDSVSGTVVITMGSMLYGCGDNEGLSYLVGRCLRYAGAVLLVMMLSAILFPDVFTRFFGEDSTVAISSCRTPVRLSVLFLIPYLLSGLKVHTSIAMNRRRMSFLPMLLLFTLSCISIFIFVSFLPSRLFLALPAAGVLYLLLDLVYSKAVRRRHPDWSGFFLIPATAQRHSLYLSIPYTNEGLFDALGKLETYLSECDLSASERNGINICCEEFLMNVVSHNARKDFYFDFYIVEEPYCMRITIKDAGRPFNPVKSFDITAAEAYERGENMHLSLQIINRMCEDLSYNYMYGQNTVYMNFSKIKTI